MVIIKFIGWVFLILIMLNVFFRLFGKSIARWMLRKMAKRAEEDMRRQSQYYHNHVHNNSAFEENVYSKEDVRVTERQSTREKRKRKSHADPSKAETVDFEEID